MLTTLYRLTKFCYQVNILTNITNSKKNKFVPHDYASTIKFVNLKTCKTENYNSAVEIKGSINAC
jgi:hypothetical protein